MLYKYTILNIIIISNNVLILNDIITKLYTTVLKNIIINNTFYINLNTYIHNNNINIIELYQYI